MKFSSALETIKGLSAGFEEARLLKRLKGMDIHQLANWAESTSLGLVAAVGDWQRDGNDDSLSEARLGAAQLLMVLEECQQRSNL